MEKQYIIQLLGVNALLIDFINTDLKIAHQKVMALDKLLKNEAWNCIVETVPAYTSLAVYYNLELVLQSFGKNQNITAFETIMKKIELLIPLLSERFDSENGQVLRVPVCYDLKYAPDLKLLADSKGLSIKDVIRLHTSSLYDIYMIGFLPGFAYMGEVHSEISMNRRPVPITITKGSVGIAGKQTGIYPMDSPGGWNIIGKTPLNIFDPHKADPCFFKAGDRVKFYSIDNDEFEDYQKRSA